MSSNSAAFDSSYRLDPGLWDIDHFRLPLTESHGRLEYFRTQSRSDWVVKLKFSQRGEPRDGSGFFVNIPHPTHYVILTAGHNLIDGTQTFSKKLEVLFDGKSHSVGQLDIHISEKYAKAPYEGEAENDYGVILMKKETEKSCRGFGFALQLGHDKLVGERVEVCGYRETTPVGEPVTSTGDCLVSRPNQIEYKVKTEKGLSGSPVIIPHKKHDTAIAIHNYGPMYEPKGSRGTRLNEKVLEDIYRWLHIGYFNKSLQAFMKQPVPGPDERLYLRFKPHDEYALVRLGYEGLETQFDILPSYAPPSNAALKDDFRYVFRFLQPPKWPQKDKNKRWVLWNVKRGGATLTDKLQDFCFPKLVHTAKKDAFSIVLENAVDDKSGLLELRMQAADITAPDLELGARDTSEVSFETYKRNKKLFGHIPCLEQDEADGSSGDQNLEFNLFSFY